MKRILITGSREWKDPNVVQDAIFEWVYFNSPSKEEIVVVHGDASRGADRMARDYARACDWITEEAHPAVWNAPCVETCAPGHRRTNRYNREYCPAAGMTRNQLMVDLGADVCLAFIHNDSPGATHTAGQAEKAGIPTVRYVDNDVDVT